jgi:hypothetical protein
MKEPLSPPEAKALITAILATGAYTLSSHALKEMEKDNLIADDAVNVLRGGVVEPGEFENGSWRYRVRTNKIYVVVSFRSETEMVVVTCWRKKK